MGLKREENKLNALERGRIRLSKVYLETTWKAIYVLKQISNIRALMHVHYKDKSFSTKMKAIFCL